MKDYPAGLRDQLVDLRAVTAVSLREAENLVGGDPRLRNGDDIFLQEVTNLLVQRGITRVRGRKSGRIGQRSVFAENRLVEDRLRKLGKRRARHGSSSCCR
jgi:hypothetical protein